MSRKYTGWDKDATGRRAGTEKLVQLLSYVFNGGVYNNGTWVVRAIRGSDKPSVHGTGRAADMSWKRRADGKGYGDYQTALQVVDFLVQHAELLTIEEIHDYYLAPHGRGWKCDRNAWKVYDKPTIGSQGGDWWHFEISNDHADDPTYFDNAFKMIFSGQAPVAAPTVASVAAPTPITSPLGVPAYPNKPVKKLSKGEAVKFVQQKLGLTVDGSFGAQTEKAVKEWQAAHGLTADGVVGPQTWAALSAA